MPFAPTWVNLETILLISEVKQWKINNIWYQLYVESKNKIKIKLSAEQKETHGLWRTWVVKGDRRWGRDGLGCGIGTCTLRSMEGLANGDLLSSTENSTHYSLIIYVGNESEREWCVDMDQGVPLLYRRNGHNISQLHINKTWKNKCNALNMDWWSKQWKGIKRHGIKNYNFLLYIRTM